jgi:peptide deformylase
VLKAPSYERSENRDPVSASRLRNILAPATALARGHKVNVVNIRSAALIGGHDNARCCEIMSTDTTSPAIATLPILIAPNQLLKTRARPVKPADSDLIRDLIPRMFATMYQAPGIGLAAPQVSHSLRLVVVDLMPNDTKQPYSLINPEVVAASEELASREEGCLSLPGQYADITRPAKVKIRYLDQTGARREIEADGLLAACLQHEIDHLDGVLFVDHLSALKRNMIMRRLAKEQRLKQDEWKR